MKLNYNDIITVIKPSQKLIMSAGIDSSSEDSDFGSRLNLNKVNFIYRMLLSCSFLLCKGPTKISQMNLLHVQE